MATSHTTATPHTQCPEEFYPECPSTADGHSNLHGQCHGLQRPWPSSGTCCRTRLLPPVANVVTCRGPPRVVCACATQNSRTAGVERLRFASLRSCLALSFNLLHWRLAICGWRGEDVAHTRTHTRKPTQRHMDMGKHGGSSVESMGHGHGQTAWHEPSTQRQSDCAPNAEAKTFCLCALRVWNPGRLTKFWSTTR